MGPLLVTDMLFLNHQCADVCRDLGDDGGRYITRSSSCRCYRDEKLDQGELAPMPISLSWYEAPEPAAEQKDDRE